jgi:hypothetical protein
MQSVKINKSIPFLILATVAAFILPVTSAMAIAPVTALYIGPGATEDLNGGSMDLDCGDLVVDGTLNMDTGTLYNVGSVIINSGGTINLDDGTIYVTKDWKNNGGTVNPGASSLVEWNTKCGTPNVKIIGDSTFFNLTLQTNSGRMLTFEAGATTSVNGHLLLQGGYPGNLLKIRSHIPGTQSFLIVTGSYLITGVDVADNNANLPGQWIDFGAPIDFESIDSGNNYRWFRSGPGAATPFRIHKVWNQKGDTNGIQVTAHLSCTGAVSTQQTVVFTATTDAILFVYDLWQIPEDAHVDCTITEDVPENYTARYNCNDTDCGDSGQNVDACFYGGIDRNKNPLCTITNRPLPATIAVTKTWVIEGADQGFDGYHEIGLLCSSRVTSPWGDSYDYCIPQQNVCAAYIFRPDASEGSIDYEFTIPKPAYPFTQCVVGEYNRDNVIEVDNGCGQLKASAGDEIECEVINTVFFEGIPTLSQYGMAILALLMLGAGFVGFRRWV